MPDFSFRQTEPSQGQNSGSFWNSGTGEGQQYSHQDPTHSHNGYDDTFNTLHMNQNGSQGTISSSGSQWNASPAHIESEQMIRQDSTGAHSQRATNATSFDQTRPSRLYSAVSQVPYMSSARSDVTGRSSPVDSGLYTELQAFDNFSFPGPEDVSVGQSTFHGDSANGLSHPNASMTRGPSFNMFVATADDHFTSFSNESNNLVSHVPVSQDSRFNHGTIINSPTIWNDSVAFLESQRSSPTLIEDWALPPPQMVTSATNSPLDSLPSPDGLSPRYVQDFPDLVDLPPYPTGDRVMRKPVGPRQSKVASDLATREQRTTGTSEASDESLRFVGRSSLEIDNTARDHPLYQNVTPKADGLYHCPWEGKDGCQHKPEKLKCNYEYDHFHSPSSPLQC
jgi:hypothetical protein